MEELKTVVIVDRRIYEKIQLYRSFLERSEFETQLSETRFICEDTAEDLSSAVSNNITNYLFLYGLIDGDEYRIHRDLIIDKMKNYPNSNFYMIFCQNLLNDEPYDNIEKVKGLVCKPFCIGIVEGGDLSDEEAAENLRCVKLLSLAMAICSYNDGPGGCYAPEYYYVTATIDVNCTNVFYAASYELSKFAESINNKVQQINGLEASADSIAKEKPHMCTGNYADASQALESLSLRGFSEYSDMSAMRREMEFLGKKCVTVYDDNIASKINTARCGLAFAEEKIKPTYDVNNNGNISVDVDYNLANSYMSITEADEDQVASPDELLARPDNNMGFNVAMLRSALPLAKELEKSQSTQPKKILPITLGILLLFAVSAASAYIVRYFMSGLTGVDMTDILLTICIPVAVILLITVIAFCISIFQKRQKKQIFKGLYSKISAFIENTKDVCLKINQYIDKYLTVYFNYHIKYNLIRECNEKAEYLKKDILAIRKKSIPYEDLVTTMCLLNKADIPYPQNKVDENGSIVRTVSEEIIHKIKESSSDDNTGADEPQRLLSPWMTSVVIETGSFIPKEEES